MIDILEIRNSNRDIIGLLDTASSVIWHSVYYGVGDFEIYAIASGRNRELLQDGRYVTRQNNDEVGIIEHIEINFTAENGYMIIARGQFAKALLDRRIIYNLDGSTNTPTILNGNVELAIRQLVQDNAINCSFDSRRNISLLGLADIKSYPATIADEKQVSYQNLLQYSDDVLKEYGMSANVLFSDSDSKFLYNIFKGADRSSNNTDNNEPIVFSVDFENLNSLNYVYDKSTLRNAALIGGEGEGIDRFYALLTEGISGLNLREVFVDASSLNRKYKDGDSEITYPDAVYRKMLAQEGGRKLKDMIATEEFSGRINVSSSQYVYGEDYKLGDIVTVQDNYIGKYANVRISEVTEVQDETGYHIEIIFGEE